jgi:hypothetical protein
VYAIISNGIEQGRVGFRLSDRNGGLPASPEGEALSNSGSPPMPPPNAAQPGVTQVSPSIPQTKGAPIAAHLDPSISHQIYPGIPRVHTEGGSSRPTQPQKIQKFPGNRIGLPGAT